MTNRPDREALPAYAELWQLATAVRDACYSAAVAVYEQASIDGLCHDGAWECALDAMRSTDFNSIVNDVLAGKEWETPSNLDME